MSERKKLLVLFVSHVYNGRVKHFLEKAVFEDPDIDWLFIYNGLQDTFDVPPYMKKFYRDNKGFDFGGWTDAIHHEDNKNKYDNYLFINSSVHGPYLPVDFKGKWTDIYLNGLNNNNIRLFGSSINTVGSPEWKSHVQSFIFCMDNEVLHYLILRGIFKENSYPITFQDAIWQREVPMSVYVLQKGWNIGCTWKRFDGIDFTFRSIPFGKAPNHHLLVMDDMQYPRFEGKEWTREELVFVKGNRLGIH